MGLRKQPHFFASDKNPRQVTPALVPKSSPLCHSLVHPPLTLDDDQVILSYIHNHRCRSVSEDSAKDIEDSIEPSPSCPCCCPRFRHPCRNFIEFAHDACRPAGILRLRYLCRAGGFHLPP